MLESDQHHARAAATRQLRYPEAYTGDRLLYLKKSANDPSGLVRLEAAIAARDAWDPIDNYAERCEPEGMPRIMRNPHPFEFIDHDSEISLASELYDLVRTIHMGSAPPPNAPASPLGYSTGRWEGNALIVTTTRINWPYFDNIGTPQSEAVEMQETFTVSDDQTRLDYRLRVTDPGTFTEPAIFERFWLALGERIELYDCTVY